jgi:hypothetical protein
VTLTPKKPFSITKGAQFAVDGTGARGLQDSFGRLIDGAHTGHQGSNAVAVRRRNGVVIS